MVKKENSVYLFIGQDSLSKDIKLKRLRQEFLKKDTEQFNLDILYAKELNLISLQERFLSLPLKAKKRIIVIKGAQDLKEDIKEFILKYVKSPHPQILLVLDINLASGPRGWVNRIKPTDEFIGHLTRYVQTYRFKEPEHLDTFTLCRQIDLKKADYALRVLNQLLKNGEKPEWILGGLRYSWQRDITNPFELRRRVKLLLNCDLDIKTGRLKADFALEKLVVKVCCL